MKKFVISLIACIAMVQSSYAATSALTESLLEYEAITNAISTDPSFEGIIPAAEFIIDIRRLTRQIDVLGTVKYKIVTRAVSDALEGAQPIRYIATLNISPNPGIGPNIVTVVSIAPARACDRHHHHSSSRHHHHHH